MEIEADQKHLPQLLEDLGLIQSNIVKTPRVNLSAIDAEATENSPILEGEQATTFRSGTMRCAYLAHDHADISEAIKSFARAMAEPKAGHMTQLKRVARYLKGVPRKALQYTAQEPSRAHLEVHVDSDWAGDTVTRRSTSGVIVRRGRPLLRQYKTSLDSVVQKVSTRHLLGEVRIGSAKLVCRLDSQTTNSRCIQTLRARRQLLRKEELTRVLVTYRRGSYGYRNM